MTIAPIPIAEPPSLSRHEPRTPRSSSTAAGTIRPLRASDIPAVVALRRASFLRSERPDVDDLARFFQTIFLSPPLGDPNLPSLVYEADDGTVAGFLGVMARRMTLGMRELRVAVATQFMVAREHRGLAARRLTRAFAGGGQDISLSDSANTAARRLWLATFGGHVAHTLSLSWVRRLRPGRFALRHIEPRWIGRGVEVAALPVTAFGDRRHAREEGFDAPGDPARLQELRPQAMCQHADDVLGDFALRPWYDEGFLTWLLARAAEKREFGPLHAALVRKENGRPLGWFMYYLNASGMATVLQVAARPTDAAEILRWLAHDAWRRGAMALSGRAEPWLVADLAAQHCTFTHEGPWVMMHSQRSEISSMLEHGTGFLSRLEGEWWLSF